MHIRLNTLVGLFSAVTASIVLVACTPTVEEDGGSPGVDAGAEPATDGGGEPEGTPDGGQPENDAGAGENDAGTNPDLDGGLPAFDGGLSEYSAEAELGVRCGDTLETCAEGAPCCAAIAGFSLAATCGDVPADAGPQTCEAYTMGCDDSQLDCAGDNVCCFVLEVAIPLTMYSQCMPIDDCTAIDTDPEQPGATETCVSGADCTGGQLCCGVDIQGFTLPLDLGICRDDCEI